MKTDANCKCISGSEPVPGGGSNCSDPTKMSNCWKVGKGCNAKCVCEPITTTSTTTPTPTTTSVSPTPTAVGQCKDSVAISKCALRGLGVNADCSCSTCNADAQWACVKRGGTMDAATACACLMPSGVKRRRDATFVNNLCPTSQSACRVSGGSGWDGAFECVDTSANIESCGGCVAEGRGQDCTAIEGASDVACIASRCVVSACRRGWTSADGACVPDSNAAKFQQKILGGDQFWRV
jgi:hypothetical protein